MPIPISDLQTSGIAARETMHAVDDILWEGEGSETLTVQSSASCEDYEEVCPLGVAGGP